MNKPDYPERRPLAHEDVRPILYERLDEIPDDGADLAEKASPDPNEVTDYRLHAGVVFLTRYPHLGGQEMFHTSTGERREAIILVLTGRVAVTLDYDDDGVTRHENAILGGRNSVFAGMPSAVVLAPNALVRLLPETDAAEVIVATTEVNPRAHASRTKIVFPSDVRLHDVGEAHYKREVREVVGETQNLTTRLFCGETRQMPGVWSSWPHHEFDRHPELAGQFDEIFWTFTQPVLPTIRDSEVYLRRKGALVNGEPVDDVLVLKSGDSARVPLGHHPICAPLDAGLVYVWFYACPRELVKRYAKQAKDGGYYA